MKTLKFDAVIFATHSDQALKLLDRPTELESEILQAFPYQKMTSCCTLTHQFYQQESWLGLVGIIN